MLFKTFFSKRTNFLKKYCLICCRSWKWKNGRAPTMGDSKTKEEIRQLKARIAELEETGYLSSFQQQNQNQNQIPIDHHVMETQTSFKSIALECDGSWSISSCFQTLGMIFQLPKYFSFTISTTFLKINLSI